MFDEDDLEGIPLETQSQPINLEEVKGLIKDDNVFTNQFVEYYWKVCEDLLDYPAPEVPLHLGESLAEQFTKLMNSDQHTYTLAAYRLLIDGTLAVLDRVESNDGVYYMLYTGLKFNEDEVLIPTRSYHYLDEESSLEALYTLPNAFSIPTGNWISCSDSDLINLEAIKDSLHFEDAIEKGNLSKHLYLRDSFGWAYQLYRPVVDEDSLLTVDEVMTRHLLSIAMHLKDAIDTIHDKGEGLYPEFNVILSVIDSDDHLSYSEAVYLNKDNHPYLIERMKELLYHAEGNDGEIREKKPYKYVEIEIPPNALQDASFQFFYNRLVLI